VLLARQIVLLPSEIWLLVSQEKAPSILDDASSIPGNALSMLGDATSVPGDALSILGDASTSRVMLLAS